MFKVNSCIPSSVDPNFLNPTETACLSSQQFHPANVSVLTTSTTVVDEHLNPAAAAAKSFQSYLTLCNPIDGSPWRRQWHPTPVLLPGKSHGRRTW